MNAFQVNINPAYQPEELKYCLNKVSVKAIVSDESFKTQNYYQMLSGIMPEVHESKAGAVKSRSVPSLQTIIMLSEKELG